MITRTELEDTTTTAEYAEFGDYILIDGVGAYTITLTPTFINYLSPILSLTENTVQQVRRRQTINDIISLYK